MNDSDAQPGGPNGQTLTYIIYGLHLFTVITGVTTPVAIVTAFLTGWPSLIAVAMNYLLRSKVRGTYLDSHFSWQIRTFWYALLWLIIAGLLWITFLLIPVAIVLVFIVGAWVAYRMLRGVLRLSAGEPMPL